MFVCRPPNVLFGPPMGNKSWYLGLPSVWGRSVLPAVLAERVCNSRSAKTLGYLNALVVRIRPECGTRGCLNEIFGVPKCANDRPESVSGHAFVLMES